MTEHVPHRTRGNPWSPAPLRLRLTAAAALVMAAGLAGAAVLLVVWLHGSLIAGLDQTALQRAQVVAVDADSNQISAEVPATSHAEAAVQVVDGKGNVLASSANLRGLPRVFTFPASESGTPRAHTVHDIPEHEHGTWRAVGVRAGTAGNPVTVYVALPTESVDHGLSQLTTGLATGVPAVVALLTGVVWLFTGRALRPVDAMRAQTAEITESDLGRRLDVPPADDALGRLATTFNDLLGLGWTPRPGDNDGSSRTPPTNCAAPSAPCTPASKSPTSTRNPPTGRPSPPNCSGRPSGSTVSSTTSSGSHGWTPGPGCGPGPSIWTRSSSPRCARPATAQASSSISMPSARHA
ncbi:cell wall metabolism sensor histidine kinase WalK [Streptomyces sp. NBC_00053]|nr:MULTISPECIES: HAMP domain-containing protein [unclassified Streptomyces]WSG55000.1 cell wall metabolism sensor histidine kinase WalK [Streptomyces sp. NBC_01732]WSX05717.1 cell wall metabolism sensor histidine kinase WalK [Streptomyces sp. NBC_00987]MCX4392031.1 cell wall metabolism sensor histidine kinase WalK [Streptomyces sp. NBC_01767]MCX5104157.1 cell wall metabolism sensor histidine kinase WalK [Streptomyces sp. NBC_00439]MCX5504917.1 cell wall metabolism sensor histidine kinase WalK 